MKARIFFKYNCLYLQYVEIRLEKNKQNETDEAVYMTVKIVAMGVGGGKL
jgi:hypothetical protein